MSMCIMCGKITNGEEYSFKLIYRKRLRKVVEGVICKKCRNKRIDTFLNKYKQKDKEERDKDKWGEL